EYGLYEYWSLSDYRAHELGHYKIGDMFAFQLPERPGWVVDEPGPVPTGRRTAIVTTFATGWPWRALKGVSRWDVPALPPAPEPPASGGVLRLDHAFEVPFTGKQSPAIVPIRPIAVGFAADVIFWGAAFAAVAYGLGLARAQMRRRRGLCPTCAYARTGLPCQAPCPECGHPAA
ncbi:MAG: hypothetical protein ACREJO_18985, partial [Phycisphaerales bacterium]